MSRSQLYNFRLVTFDNIYQFRDNLESPAIVSYLVGMTSSALLPFAFACFLMRKDYWLAALVLFLLVLIYPITLSKVALFAPLWLVAIALLSRIAEARIAVVLSLLLPTLAGVLFVQYLQGAVGEVFRHRQSPVYRDPFEFPGRLQ